VLVVLLVLVEAEHYLLGEQELMDRPQQGEQMQWEILVLAVAVAVVVELQGR
jgi:hypothetical protein